MEFTVEPYVSVGGINFGTSAEVVHSFLGHIYAHNMRCRDPRFPTEFYEQHDLFIYYKSPGIVEAFEFAKDAKVKLYGVNPFLLTPKELELLLRRRDETMVTDADGFESKKLGIGFYILDNVVESFIIFEKGYYD